MVWARQPCEQGVHAAEPRRKEKRRNIQGEKRKESCRPATQQGKRKKNGPWILIDAGPVGGTEPRWIGQMQDEFKAGRLFAGMRPPLPVADTVAQRATVMGSMLKKTTARSRIRCWGKALCQWGRAPFWSGSGGQMCSLGQYRLAEENDPGRKKAANESKKRKEEKRNVTGRGRVAKRARANTSADCHKDRMQRQDAKRTQQSSNSNRSKRVVDVAPRVAARVGVKITGREKKKGVGSCRGLDDNGRLWRRRLHPSS